MKKVVLLVDDTLTIRMFEKLTLGDRYDFLEAANGREALELAKTRTPSIILLDYQMPEMNGLDALRALKSQQSTREIPVIMVTTKAEQDVRDACESEGCHAFIAKPIDREQLRSLVSEALNGEAHPS